jgi:hypothetical protein
MKFRSDFFIDAVTAIMSIDYVVFLVVDFGRVLDEQATISK